MEQVEIASTSLTKNRLEPVEPCMSCYENSARSSRMLNADTGRILHEKHRCYDHSSRRCSKMKKTFWGDDLEKVIVSKEGWYLMLWMCSSNDVPNVFRRMTKLAASDTCTQAVIADTDGLVLEIVGKVILAFGHGTNEDTDAFIWCKALNVVFDSDNLCVEAQRDFPAFWRKVICYGILNDLQELFLRVG